MKLSANQGRRTVQHINIEEFTFQGVNSFKYLGTIVNNTNTIKEEISKRLLVGNRAYFANIKLFTSRLLSRATKFRLYKTLIRPVVCYGAETWTLSEMNSNKLRIFERRIVRRIYGAVFERDGWRIKNNEEIENILGN